MVALLLIVVVASVCVAVTVQRLRARRWTSRAIAVGPHPAETFDEVWLQTTPPRASMRGDPERRTGALTVDPLAQRALFRTDGGDVVQLAEVTDVLAGRRGRDFVNTWIEVHAELDGAPSVVYVNDGGWFGWRPLLTGSNGRLATSLASLRRR
jgi:hypothetical protein